MLIYPCITEACPPCVFTIGIYTIFRIWGSESYRKEIRPSLILLSHTKFLFHIINDMNVSKSYRR